MVMHDFNGNSDDYLESVTIGERVMHNGSIHLEEYDNRWPVLYEREEHRIRRTLKDRVVILEHVGSTSVPGLCAKPIIDIVLAVEDSADEASYVPAMGAAGYTLHIREPDWYEHRLFKGVDTPVNLHVFSADCEEADRMIGFRNHLRSNEADRNEYAAEKRRLAWHRWKHVQNYADAKSGVIQKIMGADEDAQY